MTIIHPFPPTLAYSPYLDELYRVLEPHFTIARFIGSYPLARLEDRDNYARGLELAGAPKG